MEVIKLLSASKRMMAVWRVKGGLFEISLDLGRLCDGTSCLPDIPSSLVSLHRYRRTFFIIIDIVIILIIKSFRTVGTEPTWCVPLEYPDDKALHLTNKVLQTIAECIMLWSPYDSYYIALSAQLTWTPTLVLNSIQAGMELRKSAIDRESSTIQTIMNSVQEI